MRVYVLRFDDLGGLTRAFDLVLEASHVDSCMIEPEGQRLRFLCPPAQADALVERIYQDGRLAWCSRHDLREADVALSGASTG